MNELSELPVRVVAWITAPHYVIDAKGREQLVTARVAPVVVPVPRK